MSKPKFKRGDRVRSAGLPESCPGTIAEVQAGEWKPEPAYYVHWDDGVIFKRLFSESQLEGAADEQ